MRKPRCALAEQHLRRDGMNAHKKEKIFLEAASHPVRSPPSVCFPGEARYPSPAEVDIPSVTPSFPGKPEQRRDYIVTNKRGLKGGDGGGGLVPIELRRTAAGVGHLGATTGTFRTSRGREQMKTRNHRRCMPPRGFLTNTFGLEGKHCFRGAHPPPRSKLRQQSPEIGKGLVSLVFFP